MNKIFHLDDCLTLVKSKIQSILYMNKKMITGIAIASVLIASMGVITALKTTMGDQAIELPGEEGAEKILNLQEGNEQVKSAQFEANEYGET